MLAKPVRFDYDFWGVCVTFDDGSQRYAGRHNWMFDAFRQAWCGGLEHNDNYPALLAERQQKLGENHVTSRS